MMLEISAFTFAIALAESLLLFGLLWLIFRPFRARETARDWTFFVLSYPGIFSMGGGAVAFAVPVPFLLGAPIWMVTLDRAATAGTGWLVWRPAPGLTLASTVGVSDSGFLLALELAALAAWFLVVSGVAYRMWRRRTGQGS